MLIEDVLKEFLFHLETMNYSPRTTKAYRNNIKAFIKFATTEYEIEMLDDVKAPHIKGYFMYLKSKGRKETYINSIFKGIRSFFNYCVEEQYILSRMNPCINVKWMREDRTIIKTFNDDEIKRMINCFKMTDYIEARNKLIMMVLVDTGIRNLELCTLTMENILETTMVIEGKGNKQRYLYLSPMLKKYMIRYDRIREHYFKDSIQKYNNYFLSYRGKPLTVEAVLRVVKIAGDKSKVRPEIRCSPHTLRHYFAQKQLRNGLDVYSLSRLLGHEKIEITKRYLEGLEDATIVDNAIKTSPLMNLDK